MRRASRRGAEVAAPVVVAVTLVLAGTPWLVAYRGPVLAVVIVAAIAPVAIVVAGRWLGWALATTLGASALGLVVLLTAVSDAHPAEVGRALGGGPADLLSETLPLAGTYGALALPAVVTWVTAAAAAEADARTRRSGIALALPLACLLGVRALCSPGGPPPGAVAAALLGATAVGAMLRHHDGRPRRLSTGSGTTPGRVGPASAGAFVACAVVALVAGVAIPHGLATPGATLSRYTPVVDNELVDPVDTTASHRQDAGAHPPVVLRATFDTASDGYLATAILDRYDGGTWSFDARFAPTGGRVPPATGGLATAGGGRTTVAPLRDPTNVTVELGSTWPGGPLPVLDRVQSITGTPIDADAVTGMVVPAGRAARRYVERASAPPVTLAALPAADELPTSALAVLPPGTSGAVASVVRALAAATGQRPGPTVGFLQGVLILLGRLDRQASGASAAADGGTSLAQVIDTTTSTRVATPEQCATLVAVVERYLGVPARVATGYRIPSPLGPGRGVAAGTFAVTEADAWTWAEVPVTGVGWVVVDPTPPLTSAASPPPPVAVSALPTPTRHVTSQVAPSVGFDGGHALAPRVRLRHLTPATGAPVAVPVIVTLSLLAGFAVAVPALRRMARRRLRRTGSARRRSAGAWLEVVDVLTRSGLDVTGAATVGEVTTLASGAFGTRVAAAVAQVGQLAQRGVFDPAPVAEGDADAAWRHCTEVGRGVAAALDRRQRVVAFMRVAGRHRTARSRLVSVMVAARTGPVGAGQLGRRGPHTQGVRSR